MASSVKIVTKMDMRKFAGITAQEAAQKTATNVRNDAKLFVRHDSGALRNSIIVNAITEDHYEIEAGGPGIPYAAVQEYGHPKYPNYGFTPYMRPAAQLAKTTLKLRSFIIAAVKKAKADSTVNVVKVIR